MADPIRLSSDFVKVLQDKARVKAEQDKATFEAVKHQLKDRLCALMLQAAESGHNAANFSAAEWCRDIVGRTLNIDEFAIQYFNQLCPPPFTTAVGGHGNEVSFWVSWAGVYTGPGPVVIDENRQPPQKEYDADGNVYVTSQACNEPIALSTGIYSCTLRVGHTSPHNHELFQSPPIVEYLKFNPDGSFETSDEDGNPIG